MNETAKSQEPIKEIQLSIKKSTFKAWATELFHNGNIDEQKYVKMVTMIENLKQ